MYIIDFNKPVDLSLYSDAPPWMEPVVNFIRAWMNGDDRFPVRTSGSTGIPKEIFHSRDAMTASAARTCDFFHLQTGDTALLALPATHIGGKMMVVRSLVRKLTLICLAPKSNPLADLHFDQTINFASFTPMQMSLILDDQISSQKLISIDKIILGGGEVSYPLRQRLQGIKPEVYETYGMTETISHIALKKINGPDKSDFFRLLDGVQIRIDDRNCLVISAPHLSVETIITNDIVHIVNNKEFQWLGRYDNVINTGGLKVHAEEVERKLQPYIPVPFFIAGINDDVLGQQVTLMIESPPLHSNEKNDLKDLFEKHLGKYERPRDIFSIDKFIYTETGKINKSATIKAL